VKGGIEMSKKIKIAIVLASILACITGIIIKNIYSGGVLETPTAVELTGFQYDKDLSVMHNASLTIKNIKIQGLPNETVKENTTQPSLFSVLDCDVTINVDNKTISFHFNGTGPYLKNRGETEFKPTEGELMPIWVTRPFIGRCFNIENGKEIIGNYFFEVASNLSFANFLTNANVNYGFSSYQQIADHRWVNIIPLMQASPSGKTFSSEDTEAFFFENNITPQDYKIVAEEGPFTYTLEKKLGRPPTSEELIDYINTKLNTP